jgi:hypothetical protein
MPEHSRFAICIKNAGYTASLELRKLYEVIEDPRAEQDDMIRIIDESGENYLYSSDRFVFAPLPASVRRAGWKWSGLGRSAQSSGARRVAASFNSALNRRWTRAARVARAIIPGVHVHAG